MNKIDIDKIMNMLIFFHNNTNPKKLNKTKILKLLFLCDFTHIAKYARPITYDTYYHLPKGPIPTFVKNLLDNLNKKKDFDLGNELDIIKSYLKFEKIKLPQKYGQYIIKPRKNIKFNDNYFSESELEVMSEICKKYNNSTATQLVKLTHKHRGYKFTDENEIINYEFGPTNETDREYYEFWKQQREELKFLVRQ